MAISKVVVCLHRHSQTTLPDARQKGYIMGLDMYLKKSTYIAAKYTHRNVTGVVNIKIGEREVPINFNRISTITEDIGYWRKANHIHNWFVQNVQGGVDDCATYDVSKSQLLQLLSDCKDIIEHKEIAADKMPTKSGCFFGGTDYDEYYFQQIAYTIELIESIAKEEGGSDLEYWNGDYTYRSCW